MCEIIIVPKGIPTPSTEELKAAYNRNHDGCGFVCKSHSYHTLHFGAFIRHLKKRDINENLIIHFRLATHGSVCVRNCHPFKKGKYFFAHNGVLPIVSVNDKTDSQICFEQHIYPCIKRYGWGSEELRTEMDLWTNNGSKFALMHNGEIMLSGNYIHRKGCLYSNLHHLSYIRYIV